MRRAHLCLLLGLWLGGFVGCASQPAGSAPAGARTSRPDKPVDPLPRLRSDGAVLHDETVSLDVTALTLDEASLRLDVQIENRGSAPFRVTGCRYDLVTGGRPFLTGQHPGLPESIPSGSSGVLRIPAEVAFQDLFAKIPEARAGEWLSYAAEVTLLLQDARGHGSESRVAGAGEFPLPVPPRVRLRGITWTGLSLGSAEGTFHVELENPNAFPFTVDGLVYSLSLGSFPLTTSRADQPLDVDPQGSLRTPLPLSIRSDAIGEDVLQVLRGPSASYELSGSLHLLTPWSRLYSPFFESGQVTFVR